MNNSTGSTDSKAGYSPLLPAYTTPSAPIIEDAVAVPVTDRVEVVAPESLPAGYELHCDLLGRPAVVVVPPGGVEKGQKFVAEVIRQPPTNAAASASRGGHRIPRGHFRDGCCDCFKYGGCHPMLCLACWLPPLALGQVMTRMHLNGVGMVTEENRRRRPYWSAFKVLALVFVLYFAAMQFLQVILSPYSDKMQPTMDEDGNMVLPDLSSIPEWVFVVIGLRSAIGFLFWVYMLVLLIRTRSYIRRRYDIPEQRCHGCEDCCCAYWCACCTTLQLARHTADYETYQAACCTETGLPQHAPEVENI